MEPKFIKWIAVVGIAVVAAIFAWYENRRSAARAAIEKDIVLEEDDRTQRESARRDVIGHLSAIGIAREKLERTIGADGERDAIVGLAYAMQVVPPEMGGEPSARTSDDAVDLLQKSARQQNRIGMFIDIERLANDTNLTRLTALRNDLADAMAGGRRRFVVLQLLTLLGVVVSAFPVAGG